MAKPKLQATGQKKKEKQNRERPEQLELQTSGQREEQKVQNAGHLEHFDWSGFLVPDTEKIFRLALITGLSLFIFALFVHLKGISSTSVSFVLLDQKSLLFLLACYVFGCYTVARNISLIKTVAIIAIPELLIVAYLFAKIKVITGA